MDMIEQWSLHATIGRNTPRNQDDYNIMEIAFQSDHNTYQPVSRIVAIFHQPSQLPFPVPGYVTLK